MSVSIHIQGRNPFLCPLNCTAAVAIEVIRSAYLIIGGYITRQINENVNVAVLPQELIVEGPEYNVVEFQVVAPPPIVAQAAGTINFIILSHFRVF